MNPRCIVVSGMQRAGTTIVSRIFARDYNYTHIDEDDYGTKDKSAWLTLARESENVVIHSPAMSRFLTELPEDILIVWVYRNADDIQKSCDRIKWTVLKDEKAKYKSRAKNAKQMTGVKNRYFRKHQKPKLKMVKEVHYEDFKNDPLFIENRQDFEKRQWTK